jgi:Uma2 family endonuclease
MTTASLTPPVTPAAPADGPPLGLPYRMTADQFFKAVEADVFPPDRRIGLWEGQLYEKMAKKLPHSGAYSLLLTALMRALPEAWCLWPENPILIDDFSAPLPDASVVRGHPNVYTGRSSVPKAGEIGLVVEVAVSSLRKNLTESLEIDARAGLPSYWIVNLVAKRIEVFSHPRVEGEVASYAAVEQFEPGKGVPLWLDGREVARIPVSELLPEEAS